MQGAKYPSTSKVLVGPAIAEMKRMRGISWEEYEWINVTYREEDRFVLSFRLVKRFLTPLIPIHLLNVQP